MWSRLLFLLITVFFLTMNVLLWRYSFGRNIIGSGIPTETVWHKMVMAPDPSRLEIRHHGKKIGYGTWAPSIAEDSSASKRMEEDISPEGMVQEPLGYKIDLGGNFSIENLARLRFELDVRLSTNHTWQELNVHLGMRPNFWDVHATTAGETIKLISDDETGHAEQTIKFSDLQNPDKLFHLVGWPLSPGLLAALGLPRNPSQAAPLSLGLKWEARNDWLNIGKERMRVYRLQARLLDRFQMALFISFEGQILRVELPDEIVLINDQLTILQ